MAVRDERWEMPLSNWCVGGRFMKFSWKRLSDLCFEKCVKIHLKGDMFED